MPDTPGIIIDLCNADNYTKYEPLQIGRDVFTVAQLEEMKRKEE